MAFKLGAVIDGWMQETYCTISAIQCWTSLEEYFGVVPCTVMSMMSENLFSSACEIIAMQKKTTLVPGVCGVVPGSVHPAYTGVEAGLSATGDIFEAMRLCAGRSSSATCNVTLYDELSTICINLGHLIA